MKLHAWSAFWTAFWLVGLLVGGFLVIGCAQGAPPEALPTKYHAVIDTSFSDQERQDVVDGIDSWTAAVGPDISWSFSTATPDAIATAPGLGSGELDVVRLSSIGDLTEPCLLQGGPYGCYAAGRAYLAVDELMAAGNPYNYTTGDTDLQTLTAHEVGHFFGQVHTDEISVMQQDLQDMDTHPSWYDVDVYCTMHRCPGRMRRDQ